MPSPWLNIPLADYEGHMQSAEVQQLDPLSDLFAEALGFCCPQSVAVLGVAGGNGLDRIDSSTTQRVVGLDVNRSYLEEVRNRYAHRLALELHCIDLAERLADLEPAELVHAALVFEHAGVDVCLENALSLVARGGALSVVLQTQDEAVRSVSASRFASMQKLKSGFALIDPRWLEETLDRHGFSLGHHGKRPLPGGKGLWMGIFRR